MSTNDIVIPETGNEIPKSENMWYGEAFLNIFEKHTQERNKEVYKLLMNEEQEEVLVWNTVLF